MSLNKYLLIFKEKTREHKRFALLFLFLFVLFFLTSPPFSSPQEITFVVPEGASLSEVSGFLKEKDIIRSELLFLGIAKLSQAEKTIQAGDYYFHTSPSLFKLISVLKKGDFGLDPLKVVILEGATVREISALFDDRFSRFDHTVFLEKALPLEGYLFPDTYFFLPTVKADEVISVLSANFENKTKELALALEASGKTTHEIVIMASLLEKEAYRKETMQMISGILWERIRIGMALQVDAVFPYFLGKNTFELTLEDLTYDSPYNTYRYPGLPAGPIANPGFDALYAALHPIESDYLFYLSDREGETHYAVTHDQHVNNKTRYLR